MLSLLVAFAAGIGVLQTQAALPDPEWGPLVVAGLLLAIACRTWGVRFRRSRGGLLALVAAAGFAGFGYAALRADVRLADELPPEWEGEDIVVVGVVDDLPRASDRGHRFAFRVERTDTSRARIPQRLSLAWQIDWPDSARGVEVPKIRAGERWTLHVRLRRPHGNANRGAFDLEAWLLERNLRATGYVRADEANRRVDAFAGAPLDYVQRARETIRGNAFRALDGARHAAVLVALAIGDQSGIDERAWTVFNRTGVGHLISVSGLHVTVFAMLAGGLTFGIARRFPALTSRVPARKIAAAAGLVASCGYVLLAGAEVPAQRTLAMLAVSALGLWIGRPGTGLAVWIWALVGVLAWDPWAVLAPGFWLSFFAVGLLIYIANGRLTPARAPRVALRALRELHSAAQAQCAITIGLVPLSLALFQQVSVIGPVANAIAIPLVTFAIVPTTLAAALLPFEAPWRAAHALLEPLMRALEWLAALNGAAWAQHQPPAWAVVVGVAGVLLCLAPRGVPGRALGLLALAPVFLAWPAAPAQGTFRLTALDVGQGTAIVVQTHSRSLLYDTGPRWHETADAGNRIIVPYLRASGIRSLDVMIVSHRDLDHSGGALSVLQVVPVGVLVSSLADDNAIVARQSERGSTLRCRNGQRWEWDGVQFELLFPEDDHYADPWRKTNDLSCVLRIVAASGGSALLSGDIEALSEIALVTTQRESLAADVLIVPHHGSRTSSTSSFVAAVAPQHAVFTVGYRNRYGHPRADVVARYARANAALHRTDESGALTFEFAPPGPGPPRGERQFAPRYWQARPAAG
jgi:competence protein ComEC